VQFELTGQPAGVHGSFDPPQVQAGAATTLTLTAEEGVPPGSSSCAVAMTAASGRAEIPFSLEVVAPDGGGGCASAGAPVPMLGLALALLALRRNQRHRKASAHTRRPCLAVTALKPGRQAAFGGR